MKDIEELSKKWFYGPILFTFFLSLLATRRWQQLVSPQVWDEDGTQVIYHYITLGWTTFFEPVNGYLITVPKIISAISLWVSFLNYPIVSTIFTWLFIALVGLAIVLAPTQLRGKFLCAATVFMIPSDPEVFGLPLYTFWWASILLFLVTLWDEKRPSLGLRLGFLLFGGLSSPVILLILPALYFRAYKLRLLRSERLVAFIASPIAVIQGFFIIKGSASVFPSLDSILVNIAPTFFGKFLIGNWVDLKVWLWLTGLALIGIIAAWLLRDRRSISAWVLLYLLAGSVALTVARVDPAIIDPRFSGPRYFFFPFVLTFWILIQYLHSARSSWLRGLLVIVIVIAVTNAIPAWSRQHDDLHWANHVRSCRLFPEYAIPIHFDGKRASTWFLKLSGRSCAEMLARDLLSSKQKLETLPTFAYSVSIKRGSDNEGNVELISSSMTGSDFKKSKLKGYQVIGSFNNSDADTGEVLLRMRRGDQILYRSGPGIGGLNMSIEGHEREFIAELPREDDWVTLEFSNAKLPIEFLVKIKDEGKKRGEWLAIAIRNYEKV